MKKIIKVLLFITILSISSTVFADTAIHLKIETNTGIVFEDDINVAPCDSEGINESTAYCALEQSGIPSDWNGAYGPLWINSINEIENNANNNGVYWMWLVNLNTDNPYSDFDCHQDAPYSCSAKQYILKPNDNILFYYNIDPLTPPAPEPEPVVVPEPVHYSSGSYVRQVIINTPIIKPAFDLQKALNFLISQQKENGSFGEDLYTDWTALALASTTDYPEQILKLTKYLEENKIENPSLTDYERHAMALMALGINPHNVNGENYIEKIITGFDGIQFGDVNEDNDDIFALIVLQNAGYGVDDKIINDVIAFILNRQRDNGSWDESIDMTGAAMEALAVFSPSHSVGESLLRAKEYLKQNQKEDGGWGNASSTAWAIEGILALNEKIEDWEKNDPAKDGIKNTPLDYLATIQDIDGGIKDENLQNKIWKTAYVVSALSGKTWNQIMQKFVPTSELKISGVGIPTSSKEISKSVGEKLSKNPNPKLTNQITATVVNTTSSFSTPAPTQIEQKEIPKRNWFAKLIYSIFSIF